MLAQGGTMTTMNTMFAEREVVEEAADRWWLFLLTGIAWLVFALMVFQWDFTTVYAVSYLFGVVALFAGLNEFLRVTVSSTGSPRMPVTNSATNLVTMRSPRRAPWP